MAKGFVRFFSSQKDWGFVAGETEGAPDAFLHGSQIRAIGLTTIAEGTWLEYDEQKTREGKI